MRVLLWIEFWFKRRLNEIKFVADGNYMREWMTEIDLDRQYNKRRNQILEETKTYF